MLVLAVPGSTTSAAPQCTGPESTAELFVPGDHVPLSEFAPKGAFQPVTLTVHPDVLDWILDQEPDPQVALANHVRVALKNSLGSIAYFTPASVDWSGGSVTLGGDLPGDCVVVSDLLLHDVEIVTHWDAAASAGRGGQSVGATDGFGELDYDPLSPSTLQVTSHGALVGDATDPDYVYNTADYNLFSDGSTVHDDPDVRVPAYERYIAENYSLYGVTEAAAIWLSDRTRESTGHPLAHRNHPHAFDTNAPARKQVGSELPVFQVVHCHVVEPPDDLSIAGNEQSLATFLLPPGWSSSASEEYPVLFNGLYDIHLNTFTGLGPSFLSTLGDLSCEDDEIVVGLLWNGGGALACQTMHASALDNAAQLFDDAASLLGADTETMVFTGGSRGGTTALLVASNPGQHDYTAAFVNARMPQVLVGTTVRLFMNPTHPGTVSTDGYTGYKDSWKIGWTEPGSDANGKTVALRTLLGTEDPDQADAVSADSSALRDALASEGTQVVLRIGTHDSFGPSALAAQYANHLLEDDIPLLCDVYYRFAHEVPYEEPSDATLLRMAIEDEPLEEGIRFFSRTAGCNPANFLTHELIDPQPEHVPLAAEMPLEVGTTFDFDPLPLPTGISPTQATHSWSFLGEPGWYVEVYGSYQPIDTNNPGQLIYSTQLEPTTSTASTPFGFAYAAVPSPIELRMYYEVRYGPSGSVNIVLDQDAAAAVRFFCLFGSNPLYFDFIDDELPGVDELTRIGGVAEY